MDLSATCREMARRKTFATREHAVTFHDALCAAEVVTWKCASRGENTKMLTYGTRRRRARGRGPSSNPFGSKCGFVECVDTCQSMVALCCVGPLLAVQLLFLFFGCEYLWITPSACVEMLRSSCRARAQLECSTRGMSPSVQGRTHFCVAFVRRRGRALEMRSTSLRGCVPSLAAREVEDFGDYLCYAKYLDSLVACARAKLAV